MGKSHGEVSGFVVFEVRKVTKKSPKSWGTPMKSS